MAIRLKANLAIAASALGVGLLTASAASATTFQLVYTGAFSSEDALNPASGPTNYFAGETPFTFTALFDDTTTNLVAGLPFPGFVAYSPSSAILSVGGTKYNVTSYNDDPYAGVTIAVFDDTTPFGAPGHYAIGFLQDPVADGAGVIGDWIDPTPPFSAQHLVPTVFDGQYFGAGFNSGPPDGGSIRPIPLTDGSGKPFLLTLGFRDEEYADGAPLNTASLTAVPEPGAVAFGIVSSLGVVGLIARRRKG